MTSLPLGAAYPMISVLNREGSSTSEPGGAQLEGGRADDGTLTLGTYLLCRSPI